MSDFTKELLSSVLAARQNIPRLGGSAPAAYAPAVPVANVSMERAVKTEVNLGGWVKALERFGIIPKDPDMIRKMGTEFVAGLNQYPPDQIERTIKEAPSQAILKTFYDNAVPGVIRNEDGTYGIAKTYATKHMAPELLGWRQLFAQQPERQAFGSGALGQPAMQNYRITAGQYERATTPHEFAAQQNMLGQMFQANVQHQLAEAKQAAANAAATQALTGPKAEALRGEAAKNQATADFLNRDKGEAAKELQKAQLLSLQDLYKVHQKNREIFTKHVTDPMTLPQHRAAATVQFGSNALSTIEGMLTNGAKALHPNITVVARDFLQAGRDLAHVPPETMSAPNWFSDKPTAAWNNLLVRSYDDHTQFMNIMRNGPPNMLAQAMLNRLNMMKNMDLSNPTLRDRMIRDWKQLRMEAQAAGMRLDIFDEIKAAQGWTDSLINQVR